MVQNFQGAGAVPGRASTAPPPPTPTQGLAVLPEASVCLAS